MLSSQEARNNNNNGGLHHYLINNAREAMRRGDKSAAKSCLLTARYLSINDSDVTYEIYQMAKSDGDVMEASKCFTNIFLDQTATSSAKSISKSKKLISEETRLMINELLHRYLKIKSVLHQPPACIKSTSHSTASSIVVKRRSSSETTPLVHDMDSEEQFYLQLYETLSKEIQRAVLEQTIKECESKLEQCRLMLLFLILFPNEIDSSEDYGSKLLETLIDMSKKPNKDEEASMPNLMSTYYSHGLLVSDAVPLIVKSTEPDKVKIFRDDILLRVFSFYIEFCLSSSSLENHFDKILDGHHDQLSKQNVTGTTDKTTEKEQKVEAQFKTALQAVGKMMEWPLLSDGPSKVDYDERWCQISDFTSKAAVDTNEGSQQTTKYRGRFKKMVAAAANDDAQISTEQINNLNQLFYSILELMFISITQYLKSTKNNILTEGCTLDFLNASKNAENSQQVSKKIKLETVDEPVNKEVHASFYLMDNAKIKVVDVRMKSSFLIAVKCYEKLISNKRLNKLWEPFASSLSLARCYGWQRRFLVDYQIYSANYQQAMDSIQADCKERNPYLGSNDSEGTKLRSSIQLTCCAFMLEDKVKTLNCCYSLMKDIKTFHIITNDLDGSHDFHPIPISDYNTAPDDDLVAPAKDSDRRFVYLSFNSFSLLSYCIDIVCQILKQQAFNSSKPPDTSIGHLIVLCQYEWPKKCKLFSQSANLIRKHKPRSATPQCVSLATKFTYHPFFNYVHNPSIIEEFMALLQQGYTLDIKSAGHVQTGLSEQSQSQSFSSNTRQQTSPTSTGQGGATSTKAITTRGVNKSFKEDMKSALCSQMEKSTVAPNVMLYIDFLIDEVLPYLKDRPSPNHSKGNSKSSRRS